MLLFGPFFLGTIEPLRATTMPTGGFGMFWQRGYVLR